MKRNSLVRRLIVVVVLGLATFGGWTLYGQHKSDVDDALNKVKAAGETLTK